MIIKSAFLCYDKTSETVDDRTVCSVLYQSIEIRAGISIVDEGQPNHLVSLYITLDRQSSLLLFLSASPHLWQLETMLQWRMPVTQLQSCVIIFLSYPDKFFGKSKGQYCSSPLLLSMRVNKSSISQGCKHSSFSM